MHLLDTNTIIFALKGVPQVVERWRACQYGDIGLPGPVRFEIEYGIARAGYGAARKRKVEKLLEALIDCPFDGQAGIRAAHLKRALEERGTPIGPMDLLIAGVALSAGGILVTNNTREFQRVPGLIIEDWSK